MGKQQQADEQKATVSPNFLLYFFAAASAYKSPFKIGKKPYGKEAFIIPISLPTLTILLIVSIPNSGPKLIRNKESNLLGID
jgi:hypothetical protein